MKYYELKHLYKEYTHSPRDKELSNYIINKLIEHSLDNIPNNKYKIYIKDNKCYIENEYKKEIELDTYLLLLMNKVRIHKI